MRTPRATGFSRWVAAGILATAAASVTWPPSPASAEDVVEKYDDGTIKAKYAVDDKGQKEGPFVEFFANGKVHVRALYKAGKRNGRWEELSADGDPEFTATYVDDRLHGKAEVFRAKKVASIQVWRDGELLTLDGTPAHPKSRELVEKTLRAVEAGEVVAKPSKPHGRPSKPGTPAPGSAHGSEELEKVRATALHQLQAYRFLCDVPYADLVLGDDANAHAQAASELCAKLGRIDHEPPNPGLPDDQYQFGLAGTRHCNLHRRGGADCVPGFMDDSDPSNIDRVGHRRWCLDPAMVVTGFGEATGGENEKFAAMWAMDKSRAPLPDFEAITYPARGWMPIEMFGPQQAWSIELNLVKFSRAPESGVQVRVYRLNDRFVRGEKPLDLDLLKIDTQDIGLPYCIIFRPKDLELVDGAAYSVEVSGLDPRARKGGVELRYLVHFYSRAKPPGGDDGEGGK